MTKVVLTAGQQHNCGDAKKIGRMISIGERPETALIFPKRKRGVRPVEDNANHCQKYDSCREEPQLKAGGAEPDFLRANDIDPGNSCYQTDETTGRDPRLRRYGRRQRNAKIVNHRLPPCWQEKPIRRQKCNCCQSNEGEQHAIHSQAERGPRGPDQQIAPERPHHDAFGPFLRTAAEEASQDREKRNDAIACPLTRRDWLPPIEMRMLRGISH